MSCCDGLGIFGQGEGAATFVASKISDAYYILPFPSGQFAFTGWTGVLTIRTDEAASALLTVNMSATPNGSVITMVDSNITILIKADDLATLPDNSDDASKPWIGWWDFVVTDTNGIETRLLAGDFEAQKR